MDSEYVKLRTWKTLAVAAVVLLAWALFATWLANGRGTMLKRASVMLSETRTELDTIKSVVDKQLAAAKLATSKAAYYADQVEKDSLAFTALMEGKLCDIYTNLYTYSSGRNDLQHPYLEAFEVEPRRVKTYMRNKTSTSARPDITILFLNRHGFVTAEYNKRWLIDSMRPNDYRIDDDPYSLRWRFGEPVYFSILDEAK
jgi:hypothetical protein